MWFDIDVLMQDCNISVSNVYTTVLHLAIDSLTVVVPVASLLLGQSCKCPGASDVILNSGGKNHFHQTTPKYTEAQTMCKIPLPCANVRHHH